MTRAVAAARTDQLDHLSREIWRAHGSGIIDDATAQSAAEAIQARRTEIRRPTRLRQQGALSAARQPSLNRADDMLSLPRVAQAGQLRASRRGVNQPRDPGG
jgi:hypothetical protein